MIENQRPRKLTNSYLLKDRHGIFGPQFETGRAPQGACQHITQLARLMRLNNAVANKVDKSIQTGDVHTKVNQSRTMPNISLILLLKVYANAEVQVQLDPRRRSNNSSLSSLLAILREKKVYKQAE